MRNDKDIYLSLGLGSLIQNSETNLKIQKIENNNDFAYRVNENVGILFKYSAVRTSPWSFNFNVSDKLIINEFQNNFEDYFVCLVCGINCVGVITSEEVSTLIDVQNIEKSRITLKTFTGGSLGVTGSLGKLNYKIPKSKPWDRIDLESR
jgi:hypothetical protein